MFYTDNWVFIHIPRTGGCNILDRCVDARVPLIVPWGDSSKRPRPYPRLTRHNPISWWSNQIDLSNKEAYCVVRNPYSRAVSLWKLIIRMTGKKISLYNFYNNRDMPDPLAYWLGQHEYLKPQLRYEREYITWGLFDCQKDFIDDTVRPFKLEYQLPELEEAIGVKFRNTNTFNKGVYGKNYKYYYNDETQEIVYNLYKRDFLKYDYDINL